MNHMPQPSHSMNVQQRPNANKQDFQFKLQGSPFGNKPQHMHSQHSQHSQHSPHSPHLQSLPNHHQQNKSISTPTMPHIQHHANHIQKPIESKPKIDNDLPYQLRLNETVQSSLNVSCQMKLIILV